MRIYLLILMLPFLGCDKGEKDKKELLAPGVISTEQVEYGATFSKDMSEVFFVRSVGQWGKGTMKGSIYHSEFIEGEWTKPQVVPFSGKHDDGDPHLTMDGKKLYFVSDRPSGARVKSADIWVVDRLGEGKWGIPVRLPDHINSGGTEYSPKTTANGDLYFAATRPEGFGQGDIYVSKWYQEGFSNPKNLGSTINSHLGEWNLGINDSGDLLIFEASQRPTNKSSYGDLYISFKQDGSWTIPQPVKELNTTGSDLYPQLFADKNKLVYSSSDTMPSTDVNIYYAPSNSILESYKADALLPDSYLIVVNRSGHSVSVIDLKSNLVIKEYPVGKGPHEMAISDDRKYLFVANYGSYPEPHVNPITSKELKWKSEPQNSINRIDLSTGENTSLELTSSASPHGILTNHDGTIVWVTSEDDGRVIELDGSNGQLLHSYQTMKGSHMIVGKKDRSMLFVSNIESNTLSILNAKTKEVDHLKTSKGPEGIQLSPDESELWILCNGDNKVMVYNLKGNEITSEFSAEGEFPIKMTFVNDEVWICNVSSRNITIFDAESKMFKESIRLDTTPLGITSSNNQVFITLPRRNLIRVFDATTRKMLSELSPGMEPDGILIMKDLEQVFK